MSPASAQALATLRCVARGHAGASSGEQAAWDILQHLQQGTPADIFESFIRLDAAGRRAVIQLFVDLAIGKTGLSDLR